MEKRKKKLKSIETNEERKNKLEYIKKKYIKERKTTKCDAKNKEEYMKRKKKKK